MTASEILKLFDKYGALLKGHFKLSSGLHSEKYLQCALILQHPEVAAKISRALAKKFSKEKIDVVIGPALGGITLAYEVARTVGARGIFAEREDGKMTLRRGFSISPGERVLVVEDVITTGGSTKEAIEVVKNSGGVAVGVGSIIDRNIAKIDFGIPDKCLAKIKIETFNGEACPLCEANVPLAKPGSRKTCKLKN